MSDWPSALLKSPAGVIHSGSDACLCSDGVIINLGVFAVGGVWPVANRALYIPFIVETTVTAFQMAFEVTTQSGNCDVGLYSEQGARLVSAGSTAVGAAGKQVINITDTVLTPALYFMAMNVDNTTAAFTRVNALTILQQTVSGMQQQAVGAVTLPDPATFANPLTAYIPGLAVALKSTI